MGSTYAGVLGLLAFTTTVARGAIHAAGFETTLATATASLVLFAVIGAILGSLGSYIVADSVRSQLIAEADNEQATTSAAAESIAVG